MSVRYDVAINRRIDFRELVRDLFSLYKTRIWMEQVKEKDDGSATKKNGADEGKRRGNGDTRGGRRTPTATTNGSSSSNSNGNGGATASDKLTAASVVKAAIAKQSNRGCRARSE